MEEVAFFAGAIGALGGAIAVIGLRNPFYSVLALIVHLVSLAGLFLLLHAEFIAAAQVVVYAGAVMVLYVFVAAYVGNVDEPPWEPIPGQRIVAPLLGGALFVELSIAVLGTGLKTLESEGPTIEAGFGSPAAIGELLLERFLIAFEAASLLLLLAAIGAIVLAGHRDSGSDDRPGNGPSGPASSVGTSVQAGGDPTDTQGGRGGGPTGTPISRAAGGHPMGTQGGVGGGPADTQRARPTTFTETGAADAGRASDGPPPATPQGGTG